MRVLFSRGSYVVDSFPGHRWDSWLVHGREQGLREAWFYPYLTKNDVVIDVGAAFGSWSLPSALLAKYVYAFEPRKKIVDILEHNLAKNGLYNVTIFNYAVGDSYGHTEFCHAHNSSCADCACRPENKERLMMGTIDDAMRAKGRMAPTWIKIDAEGMEIKVLWGALETIKRHKPNVIVEHHLAHDPGAVEGARNFMDTLNAGYKSVTRHFGVMTASRPHTIFSVHPAIVAPSL